MSEPAKPPAQSTPPAVPSGSGKPPTVRIATPAKPENAAPPAGTSVPGAAPPTTAAAPVPGSPVPPAVVAHDGKSPGAPASAKDAKDAKAPPTPEAPTDGIVIEIAADGMEAVAQVPAGETLAANVLMERITTAGVTTGVIKSALTEVETESDEDRSIVVAKGIPVVKPVDARIKILVNFAIKLSEDSQHHVDFREQGQFHEVDAGDALAELIPKAAGKPGTTVLGKEIPPGDAHDADLATVAGEGTKIIPVGAGRVVAERTGMVIRRSDGHLDLKPTVDVAGNLDMHTGNLNTRLPVTIKGDIIAGFSLKSGADVTIGGVIEDARVSVKGSIVSAGILPGKHRVKAHGDLKTKHITGREVKCRNLEVASDLRGVRVFATGNVTAKLVVSTNVQCGGSMVCESLGHNAELGGVIQVGLNPLAVALWRLAQREHDSIVAEIGELRQHIKRLTMWLRTETDEVKRQKHAHDLQQVLAKYEHSAQRFAECERVLSNNTLRVGNNPEATLTVNDKIYPGIEVRIGADATMVITKAMGKTVFRLKDGKVAWDIAIGDTKPGPDTGKPAP